MRSVRSALGCLALGLSLWPLAAAAGSGDALLERGRYLVAAGNCVSCHTRPGGAAFAGGLPFNTPLGRIYSSNITPDARSGIGQWSAADLRRAMHEGIGRGGERLFPAFPYPSFTKVSDPDVDAIYHYLRSIAPVRYTPPANGWVFRLRSGMVLWNWLFFKPGRFASDARQSAEWNRGAYLVGGLGHCDACHTPRNRFMAEDQENAYAGGALSDRVEDERMRRWSAVNLTSSRSGLAAWSLDELTRYLKSGFAPTRAGTFGPMNEVIVGSLMNLSDADVRAIATYLKSLPARQLSGATVSAESAQSGARLFNEHCAECHDNSGGGGESSGPPLAGSAVVVASDPASLINIVLYGPALPKSVDTGDWQTMRAFKGELNDAQIARVLNFVRGSWGNRAPPVTAADVAQQR
jgi:mono/diheme cytochrome c family protein